jgi:uncharacterized protein
MVTNFFVDTSALAKRYVSEVGSAWVIGWIEPAAGNIIVVSELLFVEMYSVLARLTKTGAFSSVSQIQRLRNDFAIHYRDDYLVVPLDTSVLHLAAHLTDTYTLRTLDSIQLAAAIQANKLLGVPLTFISGDTNLLTAAASEGFITDNPYLHP